MKPDIKSGARKELKIYISLGPLGPVCMCVLCLKRTKDITFYRH